MYREIAGSRKTVGDIDVFYDGGIYHLFHLVLPTHDYVAHAVSNDCIHWRRVENAIHIGDPGSFDDSMLWTTHVSRHPYQDGCYRMFYTALSRRDHGAIQRIGLAESPDLYRWTKCAANWVDRRSELPYELPNRPSQPPFDYDASSCFPLEPNAAYYEHDTKSARHWISFRDPYYYRDGDDGRLLIAARVKDGPIVRRGCVACLDEVAENRFEARPALHHPGLYDDVEVPNLIRVDDEYYLLGSVREDAKVRYWHSLDSRGPWKTYSDNVLLPTGNYAGRLCRDERGWLLFSFFTPQGLDRTTNNLMPPPKRLERADDGQLVVKSFEGFEKREEQPIEGFDFSPLAPVRQNACVDQTGDKIKLSNESGTQLFEVGQDFDCFRWDFEVELETDGKCGLFFRLDSQTHAGYYISLDLFKGVAQARDWGSGPVGSGEHMMQFRSLQSGYWRTPQPGKARLSVIAFGSYLELCVDDRVVLSLADQAYTHGKLGVYAESCSMIIQNHKLCPLTPALQSDDQLANG